MEGALKTTPATASYGLEALVFPSSRFKSPFASIVADLYFSDPDTRLRVGAQRVVRRRSLHGSDELQLTVRRIVLEQLIRIRIATVIDVTVRDAQQHDLAIGIRTVVHAFAQVRSKWRISGDFTQHVHAPNPIARSKETPREHASALNGGRPDFDLSCR